MNLLQNLKTKLEGIDTEQAKKVKDKIDKCITQLNNRNSLKESDIATISKEVTIAAQTNLLRNLKAKLGGKHRFLHNVKNICLYSFQALHRLDYRTGIYIDHKINKIYQTITIWRIVEIL